MDRQCFDREVQPKGPPDRLDRRGEGKRRIEVCGLSDQVGCGELRLGKQICGRKSALWLIRCQQNLELKTKYV